MIKRLLLHLKMERVWQRDCANHAKAAGDIAAYIVSFYNNGRRHFKRGSWPPNALKHQSAMTKHTGA